MKFKDSKYFGVKLSEHRIKNDKGQLIVTGCEFARTGKQKYHASELGLKDDKFIYLDRPYEEVKDSKTVASFEACPVTEDHPEDDVKVGVNYDKLAKGFAKNVKFVDDVPGKEGHLEADFVITDADLIKKIENHDINELSAGYNCDVDEQDWIQRHIRGNHIAVVAQARAGHSACLRDKAYKSTSKKIKTLKIGDKVMKIVDSYSYEIMDENGEMATFTDYYTEGSNGKKKFLKTVKEEKKTIKDSKKDVKDGATLEGVYHCYNNDEVIEVRKEPRNFDKEGLLYRITFQKSGSPVLLDEYETFKLLKSYKALKFQDSKKIKDSTDDAKECINWLNQQLSEMPSDVDSDSVNYDEYVDTIKNDICEYFNGKFNESLTGILDKLVKEKRSIYAIINTLKSVCKKHIKQNANDSKKIKDEDLKHYLVFFTYEGEKEVFETYAKNKNEAIRQAKKGYDEEEFKLKKVEEINFSGKTIKDSTDEELIANRRRIDQDIREIFKGHPEFSVEGFYNGVDDTEGTIYTVDYVRRKDKDPNRPTRYEYDDDEDYLEELRDYVDKKWYDTVINIPGVNSVDIGVCEWDCDEDYNIDMLIYCDDVSRD